MGTYRTAIGAIDGTNRQFFAPTPYSPGETRFILNGQMLGEDCITEIDALTGEVRWEDAQPPRAGDDLLLYYIDRGGDSETVTQCILPLHGRVIRDRPLQGTLGALQGLTGEVTTGTALHGALAPTRTLRGVVRRTGYLTGTLTKEDC